MATYCTRIYITVDKKELIDELCTLDVSDLGKGFYTAEEIFSSSSNTVDFYDGESAIDEWDLKTLVERVVEVINGHGTILADTFSYDYDPLPQTCYYTGDEIVSKLLYLDGGDFSESVDITNPDEWIRAVNEADECEEEWGDEWYEDEE